MNNQEALLLDRHLAKRLVRTWCAFFERFGRLTPVQRKTIPAILDGDNVLVCSATASGKTEAACAPVIERNFERRGPWTVLYLSPTRALVNDLYNRLEGPALQMGLHIMRKTGEYAWSGSSIPHILLTTPESLDSMLCRGRRKVPDDHVLAYVRTVVLDEIHLLHGNPRGEQTKWLLERLRNLREYAAESGWVRDSKVQLVGLSATVPDPQAVVDTFLPEGKIIHVPGKREIMNVKPAGWEWAEEVEQALPAYIGALEKPEKILVFCNRRKRVDELAVQMKELLADTGYQVGAHHGSLSKQWRENREKEIKTADKYVLFATSTLEIGIDIGDLDLVVLDGPTADIPAFLQRIGRGNRRTQFTRVMLCGNSETDRIIQEMMLYAASQGWMEGEPVGSHYSVLRQQAASYIYQSPSGRRGRTAFHKLFSRVLTPAEVDLILNEMIVREEFIETEKGIQLTPEWLDEAVRGSIHSVIEGAIGQTVVNDYTGESIATNVKFSGGTGLSAGGQHYKVTNKSDYKLNVRQTKENQEFAGKWAYASGRANMRVTHPLIARFVLGLEPDVWPIVEDGDRFYVFHLGGRRMQLVLKMLSDLQSDRRLLACTPYFICLNSAVKPFWLNRILLSEVSEAVRKDIRRVETQMGLPTDSRNLPESLRVTNVMEWLQPESLVKQVSTALWINTVLEDEVILRILGELHGRN